MAAAGLGLAVAPPARPVQAKTLLLRREREQPQEPPHLRHRQRDELGLCAPFSAPALAAARVTSRKAWASRQSVTWRCQPAQDRTSYWSSPTSPLARSNPSSIAQRVPATRARVASGVSTGP